MGEKPEDRDDEETKDKSSRPSDTDTKPPEDILG